MVNWGTRGRGQGPAACGPGWLPGAQVLPASAGVFRRGGLLRGVGGGFSCCSGGSPAPAPHSALRTAGLAKAPAGAWSREGHLG